MCAVQSKRYECITGQNINKRAIIKKAGRERIEEKGPLCCNKPESIASDFLNKNLSQDILRFNALRQGYVLPPK
jgi:hypothetical protein